MVQRMAGYRQKRAVACLASLALLCGTLYLSREVDRANVVPSVGTGIKAGGYLSFPAGEVREKEAEQPWPNKPPYPNPAWRPPANVGSPFAPVFGTDVRISTNTPNLPHNETFVAADPLDPLHFITGSNEYASGRGMGFWYTTDGGQTWGGGSLQGPYPGGANIQPQADATGDIDAEGNTYFGDLGFSYTNTCTGGAY